MHSDAPEPAQPMDSSNEPRVTASDTLAVDWDLSQVDETTLVTVRVTNTLAHPRQLRIDNRLDGPVSPPRRRGLPIASEDTNWDADGVSVSVAPEETVSVGYACRAPPQRPPVTVCDGADVSAPSPVDRALRSLGDHTPPRAALSVGVDADFETDSETDSETDIETDSKTDSDARPDAEAECPRPAVTHAEAVSDESRCASTRETDGAKRHPPQSTDAAVSSPTVAPEPDPHPRPVDAWFDAVEARLDTADRLSGSVHEATPVIASLGGRAGLKTLATTMQSDERALRRVAERATALADRLDETAVPTMEAEQ